MDLVIQCVTNKYATFSGRAPRKEYWLFVLAYFVGMLICTAADASLGFREVGPFRGIFSIAMILPILAVAARRMHDTDRVGWWILIGFVPIIGWIWFLVLAVLPGTPGANRFGPDPYGGMGTT